MQKSNRFPRVILFLALLASLLAGVLTPTLSVSAAPMAVVLPGDVVISEFRTRGQDGASDEFVELYNPKNSPVDLTGLLIRTASSGGGAGSTRYSSFSGIILQPGQYYILTASEYSGTVTETPPAVLSAAGIADDSGIAITLSDGTTIIDAAGMSVGSIYRETTFLTPLEDDVDQSYERKNLGCTDTNDNSADFFLNQTSSNPQNSSSIPAACIRVTNVTSTTTPDGTYTTVDPPISLRITFSANVDVTGSPTLLLETGATDRNATYASGSGSNTLTFNYTIMAGDVSADLDYVATNSLSLNGGTIEGAVGNAILTLPGPGTAGSLGANKNIVINNGIPPSIVSFTRQTPSSSSTNVDMLVFRATFSEAVLNVDAPDFVVTGTTGTATISSVSSSVYDVTISGGNLAALNGTVGLNLSGGQNITDAVGTSLPAGEPITDDVYTVNNTPPTVTVARAAGQTATDNATPVNFTVEFSKPIDFSTFTPSDITQSGTIVASLITWSISNADAGVNEIFTLSAIAVGDNGTLIPSIAANKVKDVAGNDNDASTIGSPDNIVDFQDVTGPTVTINQAAGQADPTGTLPINFTAVFSEAINPSTFTPADITQTGTATGITWSITDSGNHTTFTLSATAVTGIGTLRPSIAVNKVTDLVGNPNLTASTSTDNTVAYENIAPTVTVNQAVGQADPTSDLPINFTVVFSEPIDISTFTSADITHTGTATGIIWSVTDSGNHINFTLSATAVTGIGTLVPSIAVNKVTDVAGNNNTASASADNSVTVLSSFGVRSVIISEVAWAGTSASSSDEWVELYNPGTVPIDITGWQLIDGSSTIITLTGSIPAGGFFLLEDKQDTVSDVTANQLSSSLILANSNEKLELHNGTSLIDSANLNGGAWPAGSESTHGTMERIVTLPDSDTAWFTNAGIIKNGKDANGADIWGTPKNASSPTPTPTGTIAPTGTTTPTPTSTSIGPTATPTLNLLINEVAWGGTVASGNDEWIELYNPGGLAVDLTNWTLKAIDGLPTINLSGTIPAGGYFIIAANSSVFKDIVPQMTFSGILNNGGEVLLLLNPGNTLVDTANSDGDEWPAGIGFPNYASMERTGKVNDGRSSWATFASTTVVAHDRNNNAIKGTPGRSNWAITVTLTPSPTITLTRRPATAVPATKIPPVGRPIINEFLSRPGFDWNQDGKVDVYDEFIEIKNIGNADINLSGWKLDDEANVGSSLYSLPAVTLKVGQRMVFYGLETNILLSDGGDTVRLLNASNTVFDAYTYLIARFEDQSVCRLPDGNGSWYEDCVPTPNFTNTREGSVPSMPGGFFESPVCQLPDTLPADFLFAECRGFGANIWDSFYWDEFGWQGIQYIHQNTSRWESFVE